MIRYSQRLFEQGQSRIHTPLRVATPRLQGEALTPMLQVNLPTPIPFTTSPTSSSTPIESSSSSEGSSSARTSSSSSSNQEEEQDPFVNIFGIKHNQEQPRILKDYTT
ncbi:hypothetical protein LINGRAHAP2_LOCUS14970, partial [Linum grandiflorum]